MGNEHHMLIIGHRGSHGNGGPLENTLPAFEKAIVEGADGVELDVHASADGVAYVFHDTTLARLTPDADPRAIAHLRSTQIDGVRLVDGSRIPSLAAVLDLLGGRLEVNIEIKDRAAVEGCAVAVRGRREDGLLFSSFSVSALEIARDLLPTIPRALISGEHTRDPRLWLEFAWPLWRLARCGAARWHPNQKLVHHRLLSALHRRGVAVQVWTVNTPVEAIALRDCGVDGVLTDRPGWLRTALNRK